MVFHNETHHVSGFYACLEQIMVWVSKCRSRSTCDMVVKVCMAFGAEVLHCNEKLELGCSSLAFVSITNPNPPLFHITYGFSLQCCRTVFLQDKTET